MDRVFQDRVLSVLLLGFMLIGTCPLSIALAEEYYQWVDEQGTIHISGTLADVPPRYRSEVLVKDFGEAGEHVVESDVVDTENSNDGRPAGEERKLQRYTIPYKSFEGSARRIIISVKINDVRTALMALDTGAPGTRISFSLATELGLFDGDEGTLTVRASGIGGSVPAIRTIIDTVEVGDAKAHFLPTTIVPSLSHEFEGLLGMDFMSNYSINIDTREIEGLSTRFKYLI